MHRSIITINEHGTVCVPCGDIWMSEMELVELFGTIAPTLRAAIRAVYRSGVLKPCEVERSIRLPNGCYADVYALPMVVTLAFRINSPLAERVRNALLERMHQRKEKQTLCVFMRGRAYEC